MASDTIRVGIAGYGNLGRGALAALARGLDMRLAGVFTRRDPTSLRLPDPATPVLPLDEAAAHRDDIDVMILCGGSKDDLPDQGPELARSFTTVDSYDTHARIPRYFEAIDAAARAHGNLSIIAVGWDPGGIQGTSGPRGSPRRGWGSRTRWCWGRLTRRRWTASSASTFPRSAAATSRSWAGTPTWPGSSP